MDMEEWHWCPACRATIHPSLPGNPASPFRWGCVPAWLFLAIPISAAGRKDEGDARGARAGAGLATAKPVLPRARRTALLEPRRRGRLCQAAPFRARGRRGWVGLCLLQLFLLLSPQGTPPRHPQPGHTEPRRWTVPGIPGKPPPAGIYTSASEVARLGKVLFSTVNHEAT